MNLCESCKKFEGCKLSETHTRSACEPYTPITRADLAAIEKDRDTWKESLYSVAASEHAAMKERDELAEKIAALESAKPVADPSSLTIEEQRNFAEWVQSKNHLAKPVAVVVPEIDGPCHSRLMAISEARNKGEISPLSARDICIHMEAVETKRAWICQKIQTIPADRVLGEGGDICNAPKDRPILAYWNTAVGIISDVVMWREQDNGFVCSSEHLEHENDGMDLPTIPKNSKWFDLPETIRFQAKQVTP